MKSATAILGAVLFLAVPRLQVHGYPKQSDDGEQRVVGGQPARLGQLPFQLSLQSPSFGGHFCGASYVSPPVDVNFAVAVTAKHCFEGWMDSDDLAKIKVMGGSILLNEASEYEEILGIRKLILHPDQDIAVLVLNGKYTQSPGLNTIALPNGQQELEQLNVTISGWGDTKEDGNAPNHLQYATVPVIPNSICDEYYGGGIIKDTELCAGLEAGGVDTCQGDSGGPCIDTSGDDSLLVGITSWGAGCARPKYPGVYVKTAPFLKWISQVLLEGEQ